MNILFLLFKAIKIKILLLFYVTYKDRVPERRLFSRMEAPPHKRQRLYYQVTMYYYAVADTILFMPYLNPRSCLPGFRGALDPYGGDTHIETGITLDNPLWVPPCLSTRLLSSEDPIIEMVKANVLLMTVTVKCRWPYTLTLISELRVSPNPEAAEYWTAFYDSVVDSICQDAIPSQECLPNPEHLISIARCLKGVCSKEEEYFTLLLFPGLLPGLLPGLFRGKPRKYFPLWVFQDLPTASGARRRFLVRVLRLFPALCEHPPRKDDWPHVDADTFATWVSLYSKCRASLDKL